MVVPYFFLSTLEPSLFVMEISSIWESFVVYGEPSWTEVCCDGGLALSAFGSRCTT